MSEAVSLTQEGKRGLDLINSGLSLFNVKYCSNIPNETRAVKLFMVLCDDDDADDDENDRKCGWISVWPLWQISHHCSF